MWIFILLKETWKKQKKDCSSYTAERASTIALEYNPGGPSSSSWYEMNSNCRFIWSKGRIHFYPQTTPIGLRATEAPQVSDAEDLVLPVIFCQSPTERSPSFGNDWALKHQNLLSFAKDVGYHY